MTKKEDLLQDLHLIRQTMDRSNQLLVMDGRQGIITGAVCLIGIIAAWLLLPTSDAPTPTANLVDNIIAALLHYRIQVSIALTTLLVCLAVTYQAASQYKKQAQNVWNQATLKFAYSLSVPLALFGLAAIWALSINAQYVPALLLIGAGLALHSVLHLSKNKIQLLSLIWLLSGIIALVIPQHSHIMLGIGFGFGNIVQGLLLLQNKK